MSPSASNATASSMVNETPNADSISPMISQWAMLSQPGSDPALLVGPTRAGSTFSTLATMFTRVGCPGFLQGAWIAGGGAPRPRSGSSGPR